MIQVIPNNDIRQHTEDTTCDCRPSVQFENGEMIVVHNSFDGRENIEEGGCNLRETDDFSNIQPVKRKAKKHRCYPLKGLSKPNSCTLLETGRYEFFNAIFGGENYEELWKYCENHWQEENLLACVSFDEYDKSGIPVNAIVYKVLPESEQRTVNLGLV